MLGGPIFQILLLRLHRPVRGRPVGRVLRDRERRCGFARIGGIFGMAMRSGASAGRRRSPHPRHAREPARALPRPRAAEPRERGHRLDGRVRLRLAPARLLADRSRDPRDRAHRRRDLVLVHRVRDDDRRLRPARPRHLLLREPDDLRLPALLRRQHPDRHAAGLDAGRVQGLCRSRTGSTRRARSRTAPRSETSPGSSGPSSASGSSTRPSRTRCSGCSRSKAAVAPRSRRSNERA